MEDAHALLAHPPGGKSKSAQHKRQLIRQAENSARAKCNPADPGKLNDYDIWTFGPPCTPFSSVQNKRGDQPRNSSWRKQPDSILTFETIPELLREAYPRVALIEQVGGFGQALDGPFHPTPLSAFVCILRQIYPGVEVANMHLSDWADATRLRLELLKFGMSKYMLHIASSFGPILEFARGQAGIHSTCMLGGWMFAPHRYRHAARIRTACVYLWEPLSVAVRGCGLDASAKRCVELEPPAHGLNAWKLCEAIHATVLKFWAM